MQQNPLSRHLTGAPDTPMPAGWRRALWLGLLVAAGVGFTLVLACAMPFAALGTVAALTLPRREGLLLTGATWLANQIVGFVVLHYPWTADTLAWGLALGLVAVLTTLSAQALTRRLDGHGVIVAALAGFTVAFVVYEGALFLIAATLLGGTEDFMPSIVGYIFEINLAACAGLLLLSGLARIIAPAVAPPLLRPV